MWYNVKVKLLISEEGAKPKYKSKNYLVEADFVGHAEKLTQAFLITRGWNSSQYEISGVSETKYSEVIGNAENTPKIIE